jgi:hypothetical protein
MRTYRCQGCGLALGVLLRRWCRDCADQAADEVAFFWGHSLHPRLEKNLSPNL